MLDRWHPRRWLWVPVCIVTIIFLTACIVCRQNKEGCVSPLDYGLKKARTGEERYEVLYKVHSEALRLGKTVDYSRIRKIDLVIPQGAKSIPLGEKTDFKGVTITVVNNIKTLFLFEYTKEMLPITLKASEVDKQIFSPQDFQKGLYLLSIEDANPWVENREGFSYGATRKDIVLIEDGKGLDGPCSPYNNKVSKPSYSYRPVTKDEKSFENVVFKRLPESTYLTKLVKFSNENSIRIENVSVTTPEGTLYGDQAICVYDCTCVLLKDISIDGTYSTTEKYGYGISMNNVWNVTCESIYSNTAWGVFGTNNTHKIHLKHCDVNRFDVHCYGKDILCEDSTFRGIGGAYSSVFGTVEYYRCTFDGAWPYLNRPDYNAYVPFDIVLRDCVLKATDSRTSLVNMRSWSDKINQRAELLKKCLPNVYVENLTMEVPEGVDVINVIGLPSTLTYPEKAGYISNITVKGLTFKYANDNQPVSLRLSSTAVGIENNLSCSLEDIQLLPETSGAFSQRTLKYNYAGSVVVNLNSEGKEDIHVLNSRLNYNVNDNSQHKITYKNCVIGCMRLTLTKNSKKYRTYDNCTIYLNGCDTDMYYVDNYADYNGCTFIPADPQRMMAIPTNNKVTFNESKAHPSLRIQGERSATKAGGMNETGIQGLTR